MFVTESNKAKLTLAVACFPFLTFLTLIHFQLSLYSQRKKQPEPKATCSSFKRPLSLIIIIVFSSSSTGKTLNSHFYLSFQNGCPFLAFFSLYLSPRGGFVFFFSTLILEYFRILGVWSFLIHGCRC